MKRKCLGCGNEFDGSDGDYCPRIAGKDQACGCLSVAIPDENKRVKRPAGKAEGVPYGGD